MVNNRYLAAEIKIGPRRISARTDGGLQILLRRQNDKRSVVGVSDDDDDDDDDELFVEWDRSYYEVGLEVLYSITTLGLTVGQTVL